jgi:hypothetical protein
MTLILITLPRPFPSRPEKVILSTVYEFDPGLPGAIHSVSPAGKLLETWGQVKKVQ